MSSQLNNATNSSIIPDPPPRRGSRKNPIVVDLAAAKLDAQMDIMMRELAIETQDTVKLLHKSTPVTPSSPSFPMWNSHVPSFHSLGQPRSSQGSEGDSAIGNSIYSPLTLEDQGAAGNSFLAEMLGDLHVSYSSDEEVNSSGEGSKPPSKCPKPPPKDYIVPPNINTQRQPTTPSSQSGGSPSAVMARNRAKAVHEIVSTETTYVEMLSTLVELVIMPLRQDLMERSMPQKKLGFSNDDLNLIFGNIQEILGLHTTLLFGLRERYSLWTDETKISDLFMTILPFLKMYQLYMSMYAPAIGTLNQCRKQSAHLDRVISSAEQNPRFKGLQIVSFLILPIQRIPRYILLLDNLSKFTPISHPDYQGLDKCVKEVKRIVKVVNEAIRGFEAQRRAMYIHSHLSGRRGSLSSLVAPARKYMTESMDFFLRSRSSSRLLGSGMKQAAIFLFSDLLIIAKRSNTGSGGGGVSEREIWEWREEIPLVWASIGDVNDLPETRDYLLQIVGPEGTVTLYTTNKILRDEWKSKLCLAIEATVTGHPLSMNRDGSFEVCNMMELPGMSAYSPSFAQGYAKASSSVSNRTSSNSTTGLSPHLEGSLTMFDPQNRRRTDVSSMSSSGSIRSSKEGRSRASDPGGSSPGHMELK